MDRREGEPVATAHLHAQCPDVPEALVRAHAARLGREYFQRFSEDEIVAHLRGLARVTPAHPYEVLAHPAGRGGVECTVLAWDYPAVFSLITGLMAGTGFAIERGDVFTWRPVRPDATRRRPPLSAYARRRIVDQFRGRIESGLDLGDWLLAFRAAMDPVMTRLETGTAAARVEARHLVNERVTRMLAAFKRTASSSVLFPVELDVESSVRDVTRLRIVSQDTPAFLYALSTALALQECSIERVQIRTVSGRIEDVIDVVDAAARPIRDPGRLDALRLSVLLTKQFTYFLDRAPDPYTALVRFERMVEDVVARPGGNAWVSMLSNPGSMEQLARLLGASDYLWEDFIRLQYESLMPLLQSRLGGRRLATPPGEVRCRLEERLRGAASGEERRHRLNLFKDEECYRIDMDHILQPGDRFREMAAALTGLAEEVIRAASDLVVAELMDRYGRPLTVAGLDVPWAVLGLGKLGGAALGYASDIELLFVYGDSGSTAGPEQIENAEFFGELARGAAHAIRSKREGIFRVDLRLRPHGNSGPLACSLETFCRYYGPGGAAHAAERLALVRLRAMAGDAGLGARVERLRDDFIYASPGSVDIGALRALRDRQFREKAGGAGYNAKFSPGALVDLEVAVQILQVLHGGRHPALRTPRIHDALDGLTRAGVLDSPEHVRLSAAYDFLRRLINGLRMLRGSAVDLLLPDRDADEFAHLARRMGYDPEGGLTPAQKLLVEFETHTADVRAFVERHFGPEALPGSGMGNVADLLLRDGGVPEDQARRILEPLGFARPALAARNLRALAGVGERRERFIPLAVLACDMLRNEPDPDMALNNWERFAAGLPDAAGHFRVFLAQPRRLELLLAILSRSQFLADTLIRRPDVLEWVTDPGRLHQARTREEMEGELSGLATRCPDPTSWRRTLRRYRQREICRIGVRDLCLRAPLHEITADLSALAEATIAVALGHAARALAGERSAPGADAVASGSFALFAFGKLGGRELNYSSDVDLLGVRADDAPLDEEVYATWMKRLAADLSRPTEDGYVLRVDYRLRPHGSAGPLCAVYTGFMTYMAESAAPWELQAALKLRPIAGCRTLGAAVRSGLRRRLLMSVCPRTIADAIETLREAAERKTEYESDARVDVKSGAGGIRDIEFLVQGLQRAHASVQPELLGENTIEVLRKLRDHGLLESQVAAELEDDYIWLRRVEHYLQILHDRQTHRLPRDPSELAALARRVHGRAAKADTFMAEVNRRRERTRARYRAVMHTLRGLGSARPADGV